MADIAGLGFTQNVKQLHRKSDTVSTKLQHLNLNSGSN